MEATPARTIDQAIARVRAYAAHRNWKKSRFAAEAGIPDTTLRGFNDLNWNPTVDTLRRLEAMIPIDFDPDATAPAAEHGLEERKAS